MSKKSARKLSRRQTAKTSNKTNKKLLESLEHRRLLASPLVITQGGTYSGTFESADFKTPAVLVKTSEPVIIENATVRGPGDLIKSGADHTNITVRNVQGYGLNPNVYGETSGEFIDVSRFDNLVVEHTYNEHTTGINLLNYMGDRTPGETVKIVDNVVRNVDGRKSDGSGGYLDFDQRTRKSDGATEDGWEYAQAIQFDKVLNVPGVEIGWNEVINEPGKSRVEDVISIYKSSGTAASPIRIHDNYIQGAYTIQPGLSQSSDAEYGYDWSFSGGGIMLGDGVGSTSADDPAFVKAYGNTVISTTNYGIAISAGHDMEFYDNRVISAGALADGTKIAEQNTGMYVWDSYKAGSSHFYNNSGHDNVAGWVKGSSRNDWWTNVSSLMPNNTHMAGTITTATEAAEHSAWTARYMAHTDVNDDGGGGGDTGTGGGGGDTGTGGGGGDTGTGGGDGDTGTGDGGGDTGTGDGGGDTGTGGGGGDTGTGGGGDSGGGGGDDGIDFPPPKDPPPIPPVDEGITPIDFSGSAFHDRDGDGVRDRGEVALPGLKVYADANHNGSFDAGEESAVTNAVGRYTLTLDPGEYTLREVVPAGWYATAGKDGRHVTLSEGGNVVGATDFGAAKYSSISGVVFRDANHNHRRDPREGGISGATVFIDANNNGWMDAGERSATTRADGKWGFSNLKTGIYVVRVRSNSPTLAHMSRMSGSYFKHKLQSGSKFSNDNFAYA